MRIGLKRPITAFSKDNEFIAERENAPNQAYIENLRYYRTQEERMSKADDIFKRENREIVSEYERKFGGRFKCLAPGGEETYEKRKTETAYYVDDNVLQYIEEGLRTNKDVVLRKYKNNEIKYEPGIEY